MKLCPPTYLIHEGQLPRIHLVQLPLLFVVQVAVTVDHSCAFFCFLQNTNDETIVVILRMHLLIFVLLVSE